MKFFKSIVGVALILLTHLPVFAQDNSMQKDSVVFDVFYGYPFGYAGVLTATYLANPNSVGSVKSMNHIGAKIEKMVTDHIGLGMEFTYARATVDYLANNIEYKAGVSKYRILGKMNIHFSAGARFDPYITFGAGYANLKYFQTQPGPNHLSTNSFVEAASPLAVKLGVGVRYFFTDLIGVNIEGGLGGPLVQAGLSFKF